MCRRCARRSSWSAPACQPDARSVSSTCATSRPHWRTAPAWRFRQRTARTSCPNGGGARLTRVATASPGRPERWGVWGPCRGPQLQSRGHGFAGAARAMGGLGALSGPPASIKRPRLRRGGPSDGGSGGLVGAPSSNEEEGDMDYGVVMFSTAYAIAPDELARALEERGFESLWIPEHTHIPASRRSPWPGGPNLPQEYWSSYDPFLALTMAAAATKRLRLGTGICLVVERDPITTAKEVATLDRLSGGRFLFGIGGGWNAEEIENHGTPFKLRWKILRERVLAMKEIWM